MHITHRLLGLAAVLMLASSLGLYYISEYIGWPLAPLPWWLLPLVVLMTIGLGVDIAYEYWREKERMARRKTRGRMASGIVSIMCLAILFALASSAWAADVRCDDMPAKERRQCIADYNRAVAELFQTLSQTREKFRTVRERIEKEGVRYFDPALAERMKDSGFGSADK